ncbi:MAG: hypothetical protein HY341_03035 [Candidatus Kerfeldbacteria bacterium]|nr:hypothetical protein [Candidatus Kerfeldbacteria bacterium]
MSREMLWILCIVWMVVEMLLILWEALDVLPPIRTPTSMSVCYLVLLVSMSALRASARWAHEALPHKRGGTFVLAWTLFALVLHLTSSLSNGRVLVPHALMMNFTFVWAVYVLSRLEKLAHSLYRVHVRLVRTPQRGSPHVRRQRKR